MNNKPSVQIQVFSLNMAETSLLWFTYVSVWDVTAITSAQLVPAFSRESWTEYRDHPLAPVPVRSPVSGRVLRLLEQSERVLAAGNPIIEIGYAPRMVADFLTRDVVRVTPGMAALITDWGGDKPLKARVRVSKMARSARSCFSFNVLISPASGDDIGA